MSHMNQVGVRELRRQASAILCRVAAGEIVEVTDRGRPVAILLKTMSAGLLKLEREGAVALRSTTATGRRPDGVSSEPISSYLCRRTYNIAR